MSILRFFNPSILSKPRGATLGVFPKSGMDPKRPTQESTFDLDGATMATNSGYLRSSSPLEEWALIRYVGHPIGEVITLRSSGMIIGRSADNDICLAEAEVSRQHSKLDVVMEEGQVTISCPSTYPAVVAIVQPRLREHERSATGLSR